jgi:hypothetical protein
VTFLVIAMPTLAIGDYQNEIMQESFKNGKY